VRGIKKKKKNYQMRKISSFTRCVLVHTKNERIRSYFKLLASWFVLCVLVEITDSNFKKQTIVSNRIGCSLTHQIAKQK
jgi:hypothetical protein